GISRRNFIVVQTFSLHVQLGKPALQKREANMGFTGKSTYGAGSSMPESAEDVADLVAINSPFETPLLDALGDATRPARSTLHEWLEDTLLPNTDTVNDSSYANALTDTTFNVSNASRFRVGDQIQLDGSTEVMLVTAVDTAGGTV